MTAPAVDVRDLVKEYPAPDGGMLRAVDGVSFEVHAGEVFGFLGPNGAGKTTTLEILEGLKNPTTGSARVLGFDCVTEREEMKRRIGVQLQAGAYFDYLTLGEILDLFGSFYPTSVPADDLLARVGLLEKKKALVRELSGGQAQRFSIVASMVNDPEVVFLDEPTTGLDPQARRNLWTLITSINAEAGKTVILTTHYMEEAEILCDRVAIIDGGRIVALDTPLGLIHQLPAAYRISFGVDSEFDDAKLKALPGVSDVTRSVNGSLRYELQVARSEETLPALLSFAKKARAETRDVQVMPATLEEVFLSLTGRSLRE
jgi:ABC-2 type transport system ATP-binding protein